MSREEWLESKRKSNEGKKFGNVTVLKYTHTIGKHSYYLCRCEYCGKEFETRIDGVKNGHTNSCGCENDKWMHSGQMNRKHGLSNDRAYWVWAKIKRRCTDPKSREYPSYGGRGIAICEEWLNPENFVKWCYASGYDSTAPKGVCTLDRIDVNGNYEPSNCRWLTNQEQQNNRRDNVVAEYKGRKQTAAQWSRELNVPYNTIRQCIKSGKSIEQFLIDYVPRKRK